MFGLGMMEIGLIIALAVMLFPPTELPKLVRAIAKIYGQIRKTAEDFRNAVLEDEDLREPIEQIKGAYNDARWEVRDAERKARQELAKAQMELRLATARRIQAEREAERKAKNEADERGEAPDAPAEAGAANEGNAETSASSASPVRIAAAEPDDDDEDAGRGPVAGSDPRTVAARRPPVYTPPAFPPPAFSPSGPAQPSSDDSDDSPREGVA